MQINSIEQGLFDGIYSRERIKGFRPLNGSESTIKQLRSWRGLDYAI